jgi:hypothetical protein
MSANLHTTVIANGNNTNGNNTNGNNTNGNITLNNANTNVTVTALRTPPRNNFPPGHKNSNRTDGPLPPGVKKDYYNAKAMRARARRQRVDRTLF